MLLKERDFKMAANRNNIKDLGITNIINYLRRSRQDIEKEKKTNEDTLHEQKQLMDRVLSEYGIPYHQELEIGSGDKIATRPVFQQIIKELEAEKYDAIAVKEISRMGRGSYSDMGTIYDLIIEKRIFIITPWKIYDPNNPADLRQIRFELFMSREEFETTRERLNGGRMNAALEGKWVSGPAPFGFDYNSKTGKLIINEKEADTIRAIFDFYAHGLIMENGKRKLVQFRALATYLMRLGIKTPRGKTNWTAIQVRQLLENDRYIGILRYNTTYTNTDGKKIPRPESEHIIAYDAHPPTVDMETWDTTQYRMNNRESATNTKLDFETSRLAGICVCKKCGRKFVRRGAVRHYKKKDGTTSIYRNPMLFCGTTGCTYVRYNPIEEDILSVLEYLRDLNPQDLEKQLQHIVVRDEPKTNEEDIANWVVSKKKEIERRLNFIQEKHESGVYTDEMFVERRTELEKELDDIKKINVTDKKEDKKTINVDIVKGKIGSVLEAYIKSDNESEKNKLLHSVFSHINIEIIDKNSGRRPSKHRIEPFLKSHVLTK